MAKFFIDRPIFAWVLAIILILAGCLAIHTLPVQQYPPIAPPAVAITVAYPGASAETVQSTVVQVIEQQLSGIDHLLYFSSESDKDGSMTITLNFEQGTNPDIAQVQVQNKLQLAVPLLPPEVQQQGIRVAKATKNFLLVIAFYSEDNSMTAPDIGDFIASSVQDPVSRTPGVGDYILFGSQYAMRIWLDPAKLDNYSLTPGDVSLSIQAQNVQVASGELGGLPSIKGQELNATVIGPSRLQHPAEFGNILLKVNPDGSQVRLRDVARIELGAESYALNAKFDGHPASGLAVKLSSGANALETADAVHATINKLAPYFPPRPPRRLSLRHHAVRQNLHRGGGQDALHRHRAGLPRHVPLPAEPARHLHPDHRHSGRAPRHLRRALALRLLDQRADHVRHGAGHRPAGGRRHRRDRERRAGHGRRRDSPRARPRASRWTRSPARSSASRSFLPPSSCPWRSSPARPASSTGNFPSPSSRPWCSPS